jgi:hypothetical protein
LAFKGSNLPLTNLEGRIPGSFKNTSGRASRYQDILSGSQPIQILVARLVVLKKEEIIYQEVIVL